MPFSESLKNNRGKIFAGLIIPTAIVFAVGAFAQIGVGTQAATTNSTETVYREAVVERGDITVGVSESAVATLKSHGLSFEMEAEISGVFVKAGQTVKTGDLLATITTESIEEKLRALNLDYQEAALKLSEAQLSQQKGELDAKSSYNSTMNKADSADSTYEIAVEKLEAAVEKAEKQIEEIQTEIRTYTSLLRYIKNYDRDYENILSNKQWYEDTQSWVKSCEKLVADYKEKQGDLLNEQDPEYLRLISNLETAKNELAYAKLEYDGVARDYAEKYDTDLTDEDDIKEAREKAQDRLVEAEAALKEAKFNLKTQTAQAALTKNDNVARAELADTTYQMELKSLINNVSSKQLGVQNVQEEIAKYQAQLEKTEIVAPCDGVVISVSYTEGDSVRAGDNVVVVSDSKNVFVYLSVTQDDITGITLGQNCMVEMDAFEAVTFDGIVDSITTTPVRSATGGASYSVTVRLEGDTAKIYEGMTGTATLITRQQKDVLYVTSRTIYGRDGVSYVKIKHDNGEIEEVVVTTGFSDGRNVEITSGLSEGQTVLIESQVVTQQ